MLTINSFDVGAHELERIESRSQSGLTGKLKWQLVLEKAYLDYESNHVSSHEDGSPSKGNDQSSTEGERGVLQKCSLPAPQCYVMPEFVPSGCNNAVTVDSAPSQQAIVSTSRLESGGRQVVAVTTSASLRIHGCGKEQAPGTTAPDQQPSTFAHSAEKESLRLIKAGDGVQLSIRSGELDGEAATGAGATRSGGHGGRAHRPLST